jgi:hypothetical protein
LERLFFWTQWQELCLSIKMGKREFMYKRGKGVSGV